jgi:HlyD family secretion protein
MKPFVNAMAQKISSLKKPKSAEENGAKAPLRDRIARLKTGKLKKKTVVIIAVCVVFVVLLAVGASFLLRSGSGSASSVTYTAAVAAKRNISVTLSGSGTLQPADSYEVTSLASGEILSDGFEEGDTVEEGTVLYEIDPSDAETAIKSAELSLQKSQLSYSNTLESLGDLNVTAPADGTVITLNVSVGDSVSNGQNIGTVRNSAVMSLTIPFNSADVDSFYVGESAEVTLDSTFEVLSGTIAKINNVEQVSTGNMLVKYVTIDVANPGGITDSTAATAKVGDIACNSGATFAYKDEKTITTETSGKVVAIPVSEGDAVSEGTVVVQLQNSDLEQSATSSELSLEDAQNALDNKQEALDDYTITSPISGTVIEKNYKAGDNLDSGSSSAVLCTIYDLSYLTMEMSVDELDISSVAVGQEVTITADAVEGKTFTGTVTKVSISGTTSNGVTAYPVTVRIDDTEGLLPGMNVEAEIAVESAEDAVSIPVDAVTRGNMVLVRTDDGTADIADGETLSVGSDGTPDGFEYVQVTLGVNDDDYIEVTGGIAEGDVVAIATVNTDDGTTTSSSSGLGILTGSSSSSGGGGMPSGGGAPSGGGPMGG